MGVELMLWGNTDVPVRYDMRNGDIPHPRHEDGAYRGTFENPKNLRTNLHLQLFSRFVFEGIRAGMRNTVELMHAALVTKHGVTTALPQQHAHREKPLCYCCCRW